MGHSSTTRVTDVSDPVTDYQMLLKSCRPILSVARLLGLTIPSETDGGIPFTRDTNYIVCGAVNRRFLFVCVQDFKHFSVFSTSSSTVFAKHKKLKNPISEDEDSNECKVS